MDAPSFTLGIEEEYLLVDPRSRDLVADPPEAFMAACKAELGEQVSPEFLRCQVEVQTGVCADIAQARAELTRLRRTVLEVAAAHGMGVIAASTHPFARWREQRSTSRKRYDEFVDDFQMIIQRMAICGMHVHGGIEDEHERIRLMNEVTYFLPHLLALSTSSPFWQGIDTGMTSYRQTVFCDLPRTGLPPLLQDDADWQALLAMLEENELCSDGTRIWWDMRPSIAYPTLEMRICDVCTSIDDALALAALYQALLATLHEARGANDVRTAHVRMLIAENKWRAQRYGIEGSMADAHQRRMRPFAELAAELMAGVTAHATRLGAADELRHLDTMLARGTSAERQRRVHAQARSEGADEAEAMRAVVDWLLRETAAGGRTAGKDARADGAGSPAG